MKIVIEGTEQEIADVLKKLAGPSPAISPYIPYPIFPYPNYPIWGTPYTIDWKPLPSYTTCGNTNIAQ